MEKSDPAWITGAVATPAGLVPTVATTLTWTDRAGTIRARFGIGRMHYLVPPGLYAAGRPTADSPVLATANYKMSFDSVRQALNSHPAWILVLDTRGINVWCAAGKGTFCAREVAERVKAVQLEKIVAHHHLVLPQLSAPGVAAHQVTKACGFQVIYGPVRAADIPAFFNAGMRVLPGMRKVHFTFRDRLALTPIELIFIPKWLILAVLLATFLSGFTRHGFATATLLAEGIPMLILAVTGVLCGAVATPLLLPWLPGRAFALKGACTGVFAAMLYLLAVRLGEIPFHGMYDQMSWTLLVPTISSFFAMNFTGASTYTSLSGVMKEMRLAVPLQLLAGLTGMIFWILARVTNQ